MTKNNPAQNLLTRDVTDILFTCVPYKNKVETWAQILNIINCLA